MNRKHWLTICGVAVCFLLAVAIPEPEIHAHACGLAEAALSLSPPERPAPIISRQIAMTVTAYCPCAKCCGRWADGFTASGKPVTANGGKFCAADRSIPFGTMISIPGYNGGKPVPVLDRGGAIKGNRIDVYYDSHSEALRWGRQTLTVTIYKE